MQRRNPNWNPLHRIYIRGDKMYKRWMDEIKPANTKHTLKLKQYLKQIKFRSPTHKS